MPKKIASDSTAASRPAKRKLTKKSAAPASRRRKTWPPPRVTVEFSEKRVAHQTAGPMVDVVAIFRAL